MLKPNQKTISESFGISEDRNKYIHDICKEQFETHGKEPIYILQSCYQLITEEKERLFLTYMVGSMMQLI